MIYASLLVWMHYISCKFKFVMLSPPMAVFQHGQFRSMKIKLNRCIKLRVLRSGFLFLQWGNCCTIAYTQHNPDFLRCMWCGLNPKLQPSAFCSFLRRSAHCPCDAVFIIRSVRGCPCTLSTCSSIFVTAQSAYNSAEARWMLYVCALCVCMSAQSLECASGEWFKHWQDLKRNANYKLYWRCGTASIVQVTIPVSTVQRAIRLSCRCDVVIWSLLRILRGKESKHWFIHAVWNYVSQKVFKLLCKLFNKEKWIVPHLQHYNYFTRAGQRLRLCRCMSCQQQARRQLEIGLYRDHRSYFPKRYCPIAISSRSIGAPQHKISW